VDRNAILSQIITSFSSYSDSDARPKVEKVLKYSGDSSDLILRGDIKREAVVFRYLSGTPIIMINDVKPLELQQQLEVMIYVEQGDHHSIKEARYDRMFELSDQLIDWGTDTTASGINSDMYTLTLTGVGATEERGGYISARLTFQTIIKIQ
jgi:hypothetical protein